MFSSNSYIKYSCLAMFFWIICMTVVSYFNGGSNQVWAYLQRIMLFFIVGFYYCSTLDRDRFFKFVWLGIGCAALILSIDTIYQALMLNKWRPNSSLLGNPNKLGGFLILVMPFIFAGIYKYYNDKRLFFFGLVSAILTFSALIISGSRGALGGLIGALLIAVLIMLFKNQGCAKYAKKIIGVLLLILVAVGILYYIKPDFLIHGSDGERMLLWKSTIKMIADYPVAGVGFGNFNNIYVSEYISPLAREPHLTSPHNIFLHYLVNLGFLGGIPFIILVVIQIYVLIKNIGGDLSNSVWIIAGLVSVLGMVIHGMVDTLITTRPYAMMYWLLYGISCSEFICKGKYNE